MTDIDLAAIRERARLCAYQEWEDAGYNYRFQEGEVVANSASVSVAIVDNPYDLEHIAGMDPATTIALLDEIDRLNAIIYTSKEVLGYMKTDYAAVDREEDSYWRELRDEINYERGIR